MKDTFFIFIVGVLIYLGFSTLLGSNELMGSFGVMFSHYNQLYFGYISFIYLFTILVPLYFMYKNVKLSFRKAELFVSSILLLFASLIAQGLLVQNELRGKIGSDFVDFLSPYIGLFGLWVFLCMITLVSAIIILEKTTAEILDVFYSFIKNKNKIVSIKAFEKETTSKNIPLKKTEFISEKETLTHTEESLNDMPELEIDIPTYMRKETILSDVQSIVEDKSVSTEIKPKEDKIEDIAPVKNLLDIADEVKEQRSAVIVEELEENAKLLAGIEKGGPGGRPSVIKYSVYISLIMVF